MPTVTGYQVTGPDVERWEQLDPDHAYEDAWNRGASYLLMGFQMPEDAPSDGSPVIVNPSPDVIQVYVDPCRLAATDLDVAHLLAVTPVDSPCAKQVGSFLWNGQQQLVYELAPTRADARVLRASSPSRGGQLVDRLHDATEVVLGE